MKRARETDDTPDKRQRTEANVRHMVKRWAHYCNMADSETYDYYDRLVAAHKKIGSHRNPTYDPDYVCRRARMTCNTPAMQVAIDGMERYTRRIHEATGVKLFCDIYFPDHRDVEWICAFIRRA